MQKISLKEWLVLIIAAIVSLGLWFKFSYPQFSFVDLSLDRKEAVARAENFLRQRGVETNTYLKAAVFNSDDWADRYLQKTIGLEQEKDFITKYGYEIFSWQVRFFKELKKEEYIVEVSPRSGKVLGFSHLIEDVAAREETGKEAARLNSEEFLERNFAFDLNDYDFHEEKTKRYDQRTDYTFTWERKGIFIPWKENEGGAKLLIGVTVSGNEIRKFFSETLDIPEKFHRYIEQQVVFGEYLYSFYFLIFIFLITQSIITIAQRRQNLVIRSCGRWFSLLVAFIIALNLASLFNNIQDAIMDYPTSSSLSAYLFIYLVKVIINLAIFCAVVILPGLAGEVLRKEVLPQKPYSSFTHYIRSTFFSRNLTWAILFGYGLFVIMLGAQAAIFYFGRKYLGVWKEWFNLTQFSSAYWPLFSAFVIAVTAAVNEEVIFRSFSISWAKKYLKNTFIAVLFASVIWGLGHSQYALFPVWFRAIEVTILGLLFGFVFLKYGIIPVIVAHYLFDAFLGVAAYILGKSNSGFFYSSIFILALPLVFALAAFMINRSDREEEPKSILNEIQEYNLGVLKSFVVSQKLQGKAAEEIKTALTAHRWDPELIQLAIEEVFR